MKKQIRNTNRISDLWHLCSFRCLAAILTVILLFLTQTMPVYAVQGTVTFGSESYGWYTETVCPIGVYVNSDVPIASYEVCLEYDPTMLQYLNGATRVEGNRVYIQGSGSELTYKTMLHFEPIVAGNTTITVVSGTCTAAVDVSGNIADVSGNAPVSIEMVQFSAAPITIYQTISNKLQRLDTMQGAIENFQPDVYEYTFSVYEWVDNLELIYLSETEGAVVTVSDTALAVGENVITVSVKGTAEEETVYTLYVTRPEPVTPTPTPDTETTNPEFVETVPPETEFDTTETDLTDENVDTDASTTIGADGQGSVSGGDAAFVWDEGILAQNPIGAQFLKAPLLWLATVAVVVFLILYLLYWWKERRQKQVLAEEEADEDNMHIINLEQTVIDVQKVTMKFRMAQEESASLKEYMIRTVKGQNQYHYLTALDEISFEVKQGDVLGIIGTNGSGKSTLLKIISGALIPTSGQVEADASKIQILTLGTGFDMELTARENVYLNGAIIGYTKEYIDEKYEDIVAFAELEGFMEQRMKTFSSGMVSRLGFAIATMRDTAEILILDEVLSVGDMAFKKKSEKRIKEMIHSGATVLMVSHSPDTILKNCNRVLWIEKGELQMIGDPKIVCEAYKRFSES